MSTTEEKTVSIYHDPSAQAPADAPVDPNRIKVCTNPDGTMTLMRGGESRTVMSPAIKAQIADVEMSQARRRLNRQKQGTLDAGQKPYEPLKVGKETVYIKRLKFSECVRVHLMTSREPEGELMLEDDDDDLRSHTISMLTACVFEDESGNKPYFTLTDAADYADSTDSDDIEFVRDCVAGCTHFNPKLIPLSVTARQVPNRKMGGISNAPDSTSTTSTPSTVPNGSDGLSDTPSTGTPATSPAG